MRKVILIFIIFLIPIVNGYSDCSNFKNKTYQKIDYNIKPSGEPTMLVIKVICKDNNLTVGKVIGRYHSNEIYILENFNMIKQEGDIIDFPFSNNMLR